MGQNCCGSDISQQGNVQLQMQREHRTIKLYMHPASQPSRAVKSLLLAGNVQYEEVVVDIFSGEQKSPQILKINPAGTVPFITVNNQLYTESQSILRFMCSLVPALSHYYPSDPYKKHQVDSLLDFSGTELRPATVKPIMIKLDMMAKIQAGVRNQELQDIQYQVQELVDKIPPVLRKLDAKLEGKNYLVGDQPSIADFQLGTEALNLIVLNIDYADYPNISRWRRKLTMETAGFKEVHQEFMAIVGNFSTAPLEPLTTRMRYTWDTQKINGILNYWFPDNWDRHHMPSQKAIKMWRSGGADVDEFLKQNFASDLNNIGKGKNDHWKENHQGALAFIILCDQFSRNIHRNSSQSFAFDSYALVACKAIYAQPEKYNKYRFFEKFMLMHPLMNSEDITDAQLYFDILNDLRLDAEKQGLDHVSDTFKGFYKGQISRLNTLRRFGRYPFRNNILGRQSTQEEIDDQKLAQGSGNTPNAPKIKLIYFELHGRALQVRMILWYCGVEFNDVRLDFSQQADYVQSGKLLESNGMPQMVMESGQQMAQTMSMSRYIGGAFRGMNMKKLYPGDTDIEASFEIDEILEFSSDLLPTYGFLIPAFLGGANKQQKLEEFIYGKWKLAVMYIEDLLKKSDNGGKFLVGNSMTLADTTMGAHFLRLCYNTGLAERGQLLDTMNRYPYAKNWYDNTIVKTFGDWFDKQPKNDMIM